MTPFQNFGLRWKSQLHCHLMLILNQKKTSIYEEYFSCGTFSYHQSLVNEKLVQRGRRPKKSPRLFQRNRHGRCHFTGQAVVKSLQGLNHLEREGADKVSGVVYPIDPDHAHFDASISREVSASSSRIAGSRRRIPFVS